MIRRRRCARTRKRLRASLADESGMVTVEAAYAIAAIVVTALIVVGAVSGMVAQIRCTDASREVARLAAAGDDSAREAGEQIGGDVDVAISEDAERISAVVRSRVLFLPGLSVSATAIAVKEPRGEDQVDFAPGAGNEVSGPIQAGAGVDP